MSTEESDKEKKKGNRSSGYPAFSLEDCVDAVKKVKEELGGGFSSRDLIAKAMGYSGVTGASGTKISACVHFGLLSRSGNTYALSDLSNRLLTPISDGEKAEALVEAVNSPNLYNKLIEEYGGKALPNMLENILSRQYDIINNSAQKAAEVFKKSLEYAGLLHNGVVQSQEKIAYGNEEKDTPGDAQACEHTNNKNGIPATGTVDQYFSINLLGDEAKLLVSKKYSYEIGTGELAEEVKALNKKLQTIKQNHGDSEDETE